MASHGGGGAGGGPALEFNQAIVIGSIVQRSMLFDRRLLLRQPRGRGRLGLIPRLGPVPYRKPRYTGAPWIVLNLSLSTPADDPKNYFTKKFSGSAVFYESLLHSVIALRASFSVCQTNQSWCRCRPP
jgi:hypothetical protein